jgi:uncharacterized radical SAM superfamily Fe-S cluster-containing enzyme
MEVTETVKIDVTEDIKEGMAAYWDATAGKAKILPAAPTTQLATFLGVFNTARKKIGEDFAKTAVYADMLAVVVAGPAKVKVDMAVSPGDLLMPSASIAGYFTKRTYADLNATFSDTEVEAEVKKQIEHPRIRAYGKALASGDLVKVRIGAV